MTTLRTTILLDADLLDRLHRHAHRERTTKTALIAAALEAWLDIHEAPAALPFVAIGRSSHGRLSLDARPVLRRETGRRAGDR
jgi:hypothetical protein